MGAAPPPAGRLPDARLPAARPASCSRRCKRYGMILADNGSSLYVTGAPDPRWDNDDLHTLGRVTGADFEVVDTSRLRR